MCLILVTNSLFLLQGMTTITPVTIESRLDIEKSNKCPHCAVTCKYRGQLLEHMFRSQGTGQRQKPRKCSACPVEGCKNKEWCDSLREQHTQKQRRKLQNGQQKRGVNWRRHIKTENGLGDIEDAAATLLGVSSPRQAKPVASLLDTLVGVAEDERKGSPRADHPVTVQSQSVNGGCLESFIDGSMDQDASLNQRMNLKRKAAFYEGEDVNRQLVVFNAFAT